MSVSAVWNGLLSNGLNVDLRPPDLLRSISQNVLRAIWTTEEGFVRFDKWNVTFAFFRSRGEAVDIRWRLNVDVFVFVKS